MRCPKSFLVLLSISVFLSAHAQSENDLYHQTVSFLRLLTYGERHEDIGLRFSWQQSGKRWVPAGNGFEFLSSGLGIYDHDSDSLNCIPACIWHLDSDERVVAENDTILSDMDDVVKFVSDNKNNTPDEMSPSLYVELMPMADMNDSVVPSRVTVYPDSLFSEVGVVAMLDRETGSLILRFMNSGSHEIPVYVDNSPYPASRMGICSRTVVQKGENRPDTTVSTIDMKGRVTLPPFSLTLIKFAIGHGKTKYNTKHL